MGQEFMFETRSPEGAMIIVLTQEQKDEVNQFQNGLNDSDEWLFWNITALKAIAERRPVTYEDKYETMLKWDTIKKP